MTRQFRKQFKNQSQTGYMQSSEPQIAGGEAERKKIQIRQDRIIENQSQSGRSMIEMLGVLAIIAILSIGGIVGFRLAMNHYQANQIAHEMNMMRTDAQIKIAQGAEELMLGDPYDSGNIQFNGYKTDFDCLYLETETSTPDDVASCAVANAYYIEMQKIPEGVCKPLANLIDKMDNEIAFYINGKSVDAAEGEKGACSEGNNTLKVIFGADSDSNAVKCDTDAECESLESTPVCDETRHVCVECTEDDDCPYNTDYCEDNVCKTCDSGVWNGTDCVECTTDDDCTDKPDTPKCNTTTNQCVECLNNQNCIEKDIKKPVCNTEQGICEPCPNEGEAWNEEQQKCAPVVCTTNAECFEHLDQNYYCDKTPVDACGENETGICKKFELDLHGPVNGVSIDASAKIAVTYWNGCRICEANAGKDGAGCSKNDYLSPYMLTPDFLDCADKYDPSTFYGSWHCHERATGKRDREEDNVSHNIQDLRALLGCSRLPEENKDQCNAALNLAVYNKDYPCSTFRIGLDDAPSQVGWGFGDMTWCDAVVLGGKKHPHNGIICKKH